MIIINPDIIYRDIDGIGVLMNIRKDKYYEINESAMMIFNIIRNDSTSFNSIDNLVQDLSTCITEDNIKNDILSYIRNLVDEDILIEYKNL